MTEGELVSIVGPSGCGKSTLLRCVAGLIRPTGGSVVLRGALVVAVPDRLAVVFQDYSRSLFPWLSVRYNVALPLRRTQPSRAQRHATALEALATVGLTDTAQKYPCQLSGGMQQRVAIARALACDPVLLLMDDRSAPWTRDMGDLEDPDPGGARERLMTSDGTRHRRECLRWRPGVVLTGPGGSRDLPVDLPAPRTDTTKGCQGSCTCEPR